MDRSEKQKLVTSLNQTLKTAELVVITQQSGLTVAEVTNLRRQMRQAGAGFKVTKNRLARLALEGTKFEGLKSMFTGPTAIAYSADPIAAAKVAVTYANSNDKLKIVGGAMGSQVLDPSGVKALATLPSLDELRAKIIGVLAAPATKVAAVLQAPAAKLARVLNAYASKGDAA
ncbi:MAG: 50S ribosomal protein L10 [Dongiaceae bacterium]